MKHITLKPNREKSVLRKHPWVFSGAIADIDGNPKIGETVKVLDHTGRFLAWGAYSPSSQIRVRVWSWQEDQEINARFFEDRIRKAVNLRKTLTSLTDTNAMRLVHAESDGLPGLIADRFDDVLVIQLLSAGVEFWRDTLVETLKSASGIETVFERSDAEVRSLEGLEVRTGWISSQKTDSVIQVDENGVNFLVDIEKGHKTGFYLDQRDNRKAAQTFAQNRDVLDSFSFTGGFAVNAAIGGAKSVTLVDASKDALAIARQNFQLNQLADAAIAFVEADVFSQLRYYRDAGRSFDLILLDPPKFAATRAKVQKAARGYKDINLLALKLLKPGGILMTFSCSGGVDEALFQKIVAGAALDSGKDVQIIARLSQAADHPVALNFPEGAYLKGLVCRV